jgi:hypothetical protein
LNGDRQESAAFGHSLLDPTSLLFTRNPWLCPKSSFISANHKTILFTFPPISNSMLVTRRFRWVVLSCSRMTPEMWLLWKNFLPKLRAHLLPRIRKTLEPNSAMFSAEPGNYQNVLLKNDRIYRHRIFRINYTTYDIRREQDIINPGTSHRNIMLLADSEAFDGQSSGGHPFLYAQVLGLYHANVVYTGPGATDYNPRRFEFLWVRWYEMREVGFTMDSDGRSNKRLRLDQLSFPPVTDREALGFVDPGDVLRSCHIIPRFARGLQFPNGHDPDQESLSTIIGNCKDWNFYYVAR